MAKKDKERKTNALREIEAAGIEHRFITFDCEEALSGTEVASLLGEDPDRVFKTLVARGDTLGFMPRAFDKAELFGYIRRYGVLPRKTFSMGEAHEKRYYLECRNISK